MHVDLQWISNIFTYSIYSFTMSLDKDACHYYCINQFVQLFPMGIHKWDTAIDCFSRKSIEKGQLSSHNVFSFIINCKWVTCSWFKHCFFFIFMRPIIWIDQQVVSYVFNFSYEIRYISTINFSIFISRMIYTSEELIHSSLWQFWFLYRTRRPIPNVLFCFYHFITKIFLPQQHKIIGLVNP